MTALRLPDGFFLERLRKEHSRPDFQSGQLRVDDWLGKQALQNQEKHLSVTKVLRAHGGEIAGYYTLATGQVNFAELPAEIAKGLPKRLLPVAVLAWLGVAQAFQGQGLGRRLLALALRDCHDAGEIFAFIAVVLDCIDDAAKAFYERFDFQEMPGRPYRLFLASSRLAELVAGL